MKKIFLNFFGKNAKNLLHFPKEYVIIIKLFLGVAQLVARYLGVVEAGCSSHLTQTRGKPLNDKVERFSFLCIAKRLPPKPPAAAPGCLVFLGAG